MILRWKHIILCYHAAKFGCFKHCVYGEILFLICPVLIQNYSVSSPSPHIITLPSVAAIVRVKGRNNVFSL